MRKHKSVVAILLAVMMIFTFMPTMAFAQTEGFTTEWAKDFKSVTVTKTATGEKATYTNVKYNWSDGVVTASLDWSTTEQGAVPELGKNAEPAEYYDLNNAYIATEAKEKVNTLTYATFSSGLDKDYFGNVINKKYQVVLVQPDYTAEYTTADAAEHVLMAASKNASDVDDYDFAYVDGFTEGSYDAMPNVTLTASVVPARAASLTADVNLLGSVPSRTVTVQGMLPAPEQITFNVDDVKKGAKGWTVSDGQYSEYDGIFVYGHYDGETHSIVNSTVPGYTVSYEVQDLKTKQWTTADPVTFKDVTEFPVTIARFTVYKDGKAVEGYKNVDLAIMVAPYEDGSFSWDSSLRGRDGNRVSVANDADPVNFVNANVADSDKETAMAYFAAKYDITVTPQAADPTKENWKISLKKDYDEEAVSKQFKEFVANYGEITLSGNETVRVVRSAAPVVADKDDDISFEGQTKYVYSGKKTTKKGVLKAKKTITVKAAADSGKEITYVATKTAAGKITVSKAGKITVKKGLKKGTYKVTVKAKTAAGNGYKAAKEKQTYTIVVKK